jgi:nucleotide-binding universal stress UspA family protein
MSQAHADRVVVGVDGSAGSMNALLYAVDEARRRGAVLEVVTVAYWDNPGIEFTRPSHDELLGWGRHLLADMCEKVGIDDGDPPVEQVVVEGHPARALLQQAQGAAVLVIGHRGHGTMRSALLGSVSLRCVSHAVCPTVVVPVTEATDPAS